jgi:hypothetical protein
MILEGSGLWDVEDQRLLLQAAPKMRCPGDSCLTAMDLMIFLCRVRAHVGSGRPGAR